MRRSSSLAATVAVLLLSVAQCQLHADSLRNGFVSAHAELQLQQQHPSPNHPQSAFGVDSFKSRNSIDEFDDSELNPPHSAPAAAASSSDEFSVAPFRRLRNSLDISRLSEEQDSDELDKNYASVASLGDSDSNDISDSIDSDVADLDFDLDELQQSKSSAAAAADYAAELYDAGRHSSNMPYERPSNPMCSQCNKFTYPWCSKCDDAPNPKQKPPCSKCKGNNKVCNTCHEPFDHRVWRG